MHLACSLVAAFAAFATAADQKPLSENPVVTQLTHKTFADFISSEKPVMVKFYATWCGHCKALAPEYEKASDSLKKKEIDIAKVDCGQEADLCQEHGIEGYPTLKIFRQSDLVGQYSGPRNAQAIHTHMIKLSMPAVSILTEKTADEFKTSDKVVIIGYIDSDDRASNETFTSVAESLRQDYIFGGINDAALAKAEGLEFPSIILHKSFDEGKTKFTGKFDAKAITEFIKTASTPLVGEVGPDTYANYMSAGIPLCYIFAETPEERESLANELKPVSKKFKGKLNFATIDAKQFGAHAGNLNLKSDKFPCFAIHDTVKDLKFPFDQEKKIDHDSIMEFVTAYSEDKLEPSIKSEPIPDKQDKPVVVVVAKNYRDIVMDDKKDVLIEFYAPWCGHCKALAPKYDELASKYAASSHKDQVVIAKVDATANDVPVKIEGFPTIMLFAAGSKDSPVTYSGSRTVEDLAKFIEENGKFKAGISATEDASAASDAAPAASETKEPKAKASETAKGEEEEEEEDEHDEL